MRHTHHNVKSCWLFCILLLAQFMTPLPQPNLASPFPSLQHQVKLYQGAGNPWKSNASITLGPWDEIRVSYRNAWEAKAGKVGLQATTTLELLPDRIPLDLSNSITANLPVWAFRPIPGAANTTGTLRYKAEVVLTTSRAAFGGKRRRLLSDALSSVLSPLRRSRKALRHGQEDSTTSTTGQLAFAQPQAQTLSVTGCSTNSRPGQQCPAGWDAVNKLVQSSAAPPTAVAASTATGHKRHQQRKGPSIIPGTVSSLLSPRHTVQGAVVAAAAITTASAPSTNATSAYCAGAALVRPVAIDYSIQKAFDPEVDGKWNNSACYYL